MSAVDFVLFGALCAALGIGLIYATLTSPAKVLRAHSLGPRNEVKLARSVPGGDALAAMAIDLGDLLAELLGTNAEDETTARGQAIVQLLKSADWYWEHRVDYPPTPEAPFWSLGTYWSSKGAYTLVYGIAGLVAGSFVSFMIGWVGFAFVGGLAGAALGFLEPDSMLSKAARARQETMTIELGFSVPKLYSIIQREPSLIEGIRELIGEPGGPLIEEFTRVMSIYGTARNMAPGLDTLVDRNTNQSVREFGYAMKMAVERRGGDVASALAIQSEKARHKMRRYVEERSERNRRSAAGQTYTYAFMLIFMLLLIPIALIVAQSLTGGTF